MSRAGLKPTIPAEAQSIWFYNIFVAPYVCTGFPCVLSQLRVHRTEEILRARSHGTTKNGKG
jgi:hypothetical protein